MFSRRNATRDANAATYQRVVVVTQAGLPSAASNRRDLSNQDLVTPASQWIFARPQRHARSNRKKHLWISRPSIYLHCICTNEVNDRPRPGLVISTKRTTYVTENHCSHQPFFSDITAAEKPATSSSNLAPAKDAIIYFVRVKNPQQYKHL